MKKIRALILVGGQRVCYSYGRSRGDFLSGAAVDEDEEMIDLPVMGAIRAIHHEKSEDNHGRYLQRDPPGGSTEARPLLLSRERKSSLRWLQSRKSQRTEAKRGSRPRRTSLWNNLLPLWQSGLFLYPTSPQHRRPHHHPPIIVPDCCR